MKYSVARKNRNDLLNIVKSTSLILSSVDFYFIFVKASHRKSSDSRYTAESEHFINLAISTYPFSRRIGNVTTFSMLSLLVLGISEVLNHTRKLLYIMSECRLAKYFSISTKIAFFGFCVPNVL